MPYKLQGTAVVRSDTGALVKRHPTREKALAHLRALKANVEEGVLESLLGEVWSVAPGPVVLDGRLRPGDRVRVPVKGGESLVGRVVRPSDRQPETHVLVAPEGGGPHVEASVRSAVHDTPERHAGEREKRQAERMAQLPPQPPPARPGQPASAAKPGPVREGVSMLLETFNPSELRDFHGRWIGTSRGKVLRLFHGQTSLGDVERGDHGQLVGGVQRVASEAGRPIPSADAERVVRTAEGTPEPSPRVVPKGGANELRGGIPRASPLDEMVNFGGVPTSKGDVIRTLQREGHPQVYIDRYMQGLERAAPSTTYRERRAARAERLRGYAGANEARAKAGYEASRARVEQIPLGEPIHGPADRRRRDRAFSGMERSFKDQAKAERQRSRADTIEQQAARSVYSDDHDAVVQLESRLKDLEQQRDQIKAYNATAKKAAKAGGTGDVSLLTPAQREQLAGHRRAGKPFIGEGDAFPAFTLRNLQGNISRTRKRLEQLRQQARSQLREGFVAAPTVTPLAPKETPAQSAARAKGQVAAARKSVGNFNALHPRGSAGKFRSKGGVKSRSSKRATRSPSSAGRTLNVGAKGQLVRSIQRQLHLPASGTYDERTKAAVTRYQRQHGLLVDGIVGAQTLAALRGNPNARSVKPGPITTAQARVSSPAKSKSSSAAKSSASKAKPKPGASGAPMGMAGGTVV